MFLKKNKNKLLFELISKRSYISAENGLTFVDQEHLGLEISAQIVIVERKCHLHEFFQQQAWTMSIITNGDIIIIIITTVIIIMK